MWKHQRTKSVEVTEDKRRKMSLRSRALKSHRKFGKKTKKSSSSCRCQLCMNDQKKIVPDELQKFLLRKALDLCEEHFFKQRKEFADFGIFPMPFSFLSSADLFFLVEDVMKELENVLKESQLLKVDEEAQKSPFLLDKSNFNRAEVKKLITERFQSKFEEQLAKKVQIRKYSLALTDKGISLNSNEDNFGIVVDLPVLLGIKTEKYNLDINYFGVFDGHAGKGAAFYCRMFLHSNIIGCIRDWSREGILDSIKNGIIEGFEQTDKEFVAHTNRHECRSGSTAVILMDVKISNKDGTGREQYFFLANAGDSSGIVVCNSTIVLETKDHSATTHLEDKKRIQDAGGRIVFWYGRAKVNGVLSVTRSIGDSKYKKFVIATPEVKMYKVETKEEEKKTEGEEKIPNFFVLASDGLWDVMDRKKVKEFVEEKLKSGKQEETISLSAQLKAIAMQRKSKDNVTVMFAKL